MLSWMCQVLSDSIVGSTGRSYHMFPGLSGPTHYLHIPPHQDTTRYVAGLLYMWSALLCVCVPSFRL